MKKTILLIIFMLFFIKATDAQWYSRQCGVIDLNICTSDEFECLWKKASNTSKVGCITTIAGSSCLTVGMFIAFAEMTGKSKAIFTGEDYKEKNFSPILVIGGILLYVGTPIWITGAIRKSKLRKTPNYNNLNLGSLNVSPIISVNQFNDTYYFGMSVSLNF